MAGADVIAAYAAAWRETDGRRRLDLLEDAWAPDAVYCDPMAYVTGREALADHIGGTQAALPGSRLAITGEPDRHHDSAYFRWSMTDADGATTLTGFDVVQFDEEGRISRLTGFFDQGS